jgi:hypothetical protein
MEYRGSDPQASNRGWFVSEHVDWVKAYARQADKDFVAWELYEKHPEAVAAECHKLHFLQMACEKLCKAHLIQRGTPPRDLQGSHGYIANPLRIVIREQMRRMRRNLDGTQGVLTQIRLLANEIELLNPATRRDGQRPDNCEYPWEAGDDVISPRNWSFTPSRLCNAQAGRTFLKLLREAINSLL